MATSATEVSNFFWHCLVAAKLTDEVEQNPATKSHVARAVRMATLCAAGRNGVQYASVSAIAEKDSQRKRWDRCGFIKEHVVPVSQIVARVRNQLEVTRGGPQAGLLAELSGNDIQGLTPAVIDLFQQHPRASHVARIIHKWTLLAWITKEENELFDDKDRHGGISIRKRMPNGWTEEQDIFARYNACGISVFPI